MDRIDFTTSTAGLNKPVSLREPKLIDPSARLRIADRSDTVEFSSTLTKTAAADSMERLIAAKVTTPVESVPATPARPAPAGSAIRFYTNPTEQNAAATMGAGSKLDVLA